MKETNMNIEARKYQVIEQVVNISEEGLNKLENILQELYLDPQIKEKLTKRALQSEVKKAGCIHLKKQNQDLISDSVCESDNYKLIP